MLTRCRPLLGTFVEITVPGSAIAHIDLAFAAIEHVQQRMSFHDEGSDLAKLRSVVPGTVVEVAPETVEVLRLALDLHSQSGGLFDIAIGRELVRGGFLPRPPLARRNRLAGNSDDIEIVDANHIRCHQTMLIDLGGIAKGYAVDRAVAALQQACVPAGLVNAGGDLRMFGERDWDILLREADDTVRMHVSLSNCAIASSANLSNRKRRFGRWYTPHIGFNRHPILCGRRISVVAPDCAVADAMTKVAMADHALAVEILASYGGRVLDESEQGLVS